MRVSAALPLLALLGLLAPWSGAQAQGAPGAKTEVTFSLDFVPLGRHAPWYVALGKGYYAEEGLDVKIIPGKGTAQLFQALESGLAQFAFADVPGVVLARAGGSTARMVAVNYQKAPYAVFSLDPGADITKPADLVGKEIASSAGSFTPSVIMGFMRQHQLDPATVKFTNVDPSARVGMLLSRSVPAIETFIFSEPGIARQVKDAKLATFFLGAHGLDLYANGITARDAYIAEHPDVVKGFVRASLRGWQAALAKPAEAADIEVGLVKGLQRETVLAELQILRSLAVTPDTQQNGLGWIDPAKMQASVDFVAKYAGVKGPVPAAADVYRADFMPSPAIKP
jgi:NitT/TauT family transport system substrate-binding protein